ncbi:hypothetical protein BXZ70DRAFT_876429, partial [Cristinia sonorae]
GAVVYEMGTSEAAQWLMKPDIKTTLLEKYDANSTATGRQFTILCEYVPTSLDLDSPTWSTQVEMKNDIASNTILEGKWVKKVERRNEGQRTAHLFLTLTNADIAN